MTNTLERRWDRLHLTLKDWLQIAALIGALVMQYVAMDRRLTVVETKMDLILTGKMAGK